VVAKDGEDVTDQSAIQTFGESLHKAKRDVQTFANSQGKTIATQTVYKANREHRYGRPVYTEAEMRTMPCPFKAGEDAEL
jgi:hypothetical protein